MAQLVKQAQRCKGLVAALQQCTGSPALLQQVPLPGVVMMQHSWLQRRHTWVPEVPGSAVAPNHCMSSNRITIRNKFYCDTGFKHSFASSSSGGGSASKDGIPAAAAAATASQSEAAAGHASASAAGFTASSLQKLQLPPAVVAGATHVVAGASQLSRATARQVASLLKLVQQTSLSQAVSLQLSSVWQEHSRAITAAAAAAAVAGLHHYVMYPVAGLLYDVSQPAAAMSSLMASAAAVGGLGLLVRSRFIIDPEQVYQVAMRKLTHHAGLQEVMGSPLAGSPVRVQLVTRGSLFIQETLLPRRRAPRILMLFPLQGPLRSGVVSLQAKKTAAGKYAFKSLLVELPDKQLAGAAGMQAAAEAAAKASSSSSSSSSTNADSSSNADSREAARIYIVGAPKPGTGSESSGALSDSMSTAAKEPRTPSAQVLLELLQQPLVFALQQNVVVFEAEDEVESELGYDTVLDPEQLSLLDWTKQAASVTFAWSKEAGCKALQLLRKTAKAVAAKTAAVKGARPSTGIGAAGPSSSSNVGPTPKD